MDEKDLQELKLEEIMREFHEESSEISLPGDIPLNIDENPEEETPDREEKTDPAENAGQDSLETELPEQIQDEPEEVQNDSRQLAQENVEKPAEEAESVTDDTIRMDFSRCKEVERDTIRLDGITSKFPKSKAGKKAVNTDLEDTQVLDLPGREEPFSENWEPDYEQPMGEYVPPQPIVFQPRSRLRELKKALVAGPEKRFYEISEKGFGKLQLAIVLSFAVSFVAVAATVIYALGMVQQDRMRLMVFGQFFTMLLSGLLGINLMMDGIADLFHKKFSLNLMLFFTFGACCVDGVLALRQLRVPCCAAFCLQVSMALISAYERRKTEISQMDTMRKASRLDGVAVCPDFCEEKPGLLRKEAQVEEFMDCYDDTSKQEKILNIYGIIALLGSVAVAVLAAVYHDVYVAVRVLAVTLLAALPATAFITVTRPYSVLEGRLHSLGTVLCGWKSVKKLSEKALFPLTHEDIYPSGSARLNGVKFYGSREPDQIVAYCTAVIAADGGGLAPVFNQVLDSRNGYHYDAVNLKIYDGGIGAEVEGEPVLAGSQSFLKKMGVDIPEGIRVSNAVCVSIDGEFSGLFAVTFDKVRSSHVGMAALCSYKNILPVLISSDFMLNDQFIQTKFGIKPNRVLLPDQDARQQLRAKTLPEEAPSLLLTTRPGLASIAFGVTGARSLQTATTLGVAVHLIGGILGLVMMTLLVVLGALELLTPVNMFLYQLVWIIPGFLITEWTRTL